MYCSDRGLRKQAFEAWTQRGQLNLEERNNLTIAQEILKLRKRIAELFGYQTFAEYQCVDRMAKTPQAVQNLLETVWEKAKVSANQERQMMEDYLKDSGVEWEGGIQPWDWRYVAEQVRKAKYDLDESELKPYFSLQSVRNALFGVSGRLFGLEYVPRPDITTYHPDVELYEVRRKDDKELVSLFLHDNFLRPFKGSGAWMSEYRSQTKNLSPDDDKIQGIPIVSNNNNFAKGNSAATTLLSYDGKSPTAAVLL
jgi:peptidyl-dipeptidase Dcp